MEAVPKIVHQIWLGKAIRPVDWIKSVKEFCSDHGYKYMLWTDSNIGHLGIEDIPGLNALFNQQKRGEAAASAQGKSDIIRLLALYKFGGIYMDADTVITRPAKFADFIEKNKAAVFFGWENPKKDLIANGLIGSWPRHAFIRTLLEGIVKHAQAEKGEPAWKQLGPLFVTHTYDEKKEWFPDVHIYPMKFFYPVHWIGIRDPDHHKKVALPEESMLFQYGYTTNGFDKHYWEEKNGL
jgi:mannosyltransferase OCH1-like enzyme